MVCLPTCSLTEAGGSTIPGCWSTGTRPCIDACATEARTRAYLAANRGVTGLPVRTRVNTHHHGGHTHGNSLFQEATIVAYERNRTALIEAGLWRVPVFWTPFDLGAVELEPPSLTYSDGLVLRLCLTVAWDRRGPRRRQVMPSVGVVGAGTMGVGITYVLAAAGCRISVVEPDPGRAKALHQLLLEQAA